MADISTVRDAILEAKANFEAWRSEFEGAFYAPDARLAIQTLWHALTPEMHKALKIDNPAAYKQIEELIGG
jgi:hypothetical protein